MLTVYLAEDNLANSCFSRAGIQSPIISKCLISVYTSLYVISSDQQLAGSCQTHLSALGRLKQQDQHPVHHAPPVVLLLIWL